MKLQRLRGAIAAALLFAAPAFATEQSSYVAPITGPMNMATFVGTYLNPALRALASCSWGPSAPANGPGAAALAYQCWADTTTNPVVLKFYDGTSWVNFGKLNTSTHSWTPVRAGTDLGTASVANTGTSGANLGFLNAANTWSATQTFGNVTFNPTTGIGGVQINGPAAASTTFDVSSVAGQSTYIRFGNGTQGYAEHHVNGTNGNYCLNFQGGSAPFCAVRSGHVNNTLVLSGGFSGFAGMGAPKSPIHINNNVATGFLDTFTEYQILLNEQATAAGSYGFGIRSGTLVANTGSGFAWDYAGSQTVMTLDNTALASIAHIITSSASNALVAGRQGATSPALQVDASAATSATGWKMTARAAGGQGSSLDVISSGTNESGRINAKGSANLYIQDTGTGVLSLGANGGGVTAQSFFYTTSNSSQCGAFGANGQTNPAFQVDCSAASIATGVKVTGAAAGGGAVLSAASSASDETLLINAKGAGAIYFGQASTGTAVFFRPTQFGSAGSLAGQQVWANATSGTITINPATGALGTQTITIPAASGTMELKIASGTKALATSAIASATCTSAQTDTATGATTSSVVDASFASDPTGVTGYAPATSGMLTIISWATANTVNFKVCNNTAGSITPGAISLNWRVRS